MGKSLSDLDYGMSECLLSIMLCMGVVLSLGSDGSK